MNKDILHYFKLITDSYVLNLYDDIDEDNIEEESNNFTIPINLISEENIKNRYIDSVKATIRNSIEYKNWVKWFHLKYTPAICAVTDNTTTLDVHHHPITMEDLVDIALNYIYDNHLTFSSFLIGDIVIRWHYKDMIGACYLCKTYHDRFHKIHDVDIPEDKVEWNIDNFMNDPIIKLYLNEYHIGKICNYMPKLVKDRYDLFKGYVNYDGNNVTSYNSFKQPD